MVSAAAQIISTLVPFSFVIVTLTLGLYFLLNPKKRPRCCCSNRVAPESNGDVTQEAKLPELKTERKDTVAGDITAPPAKLCRKKSVTFNITRSIIFTPPTTAKIEKVGVFGSSVVSVSSSLGSSSDTNSSVSSDTDSSVGSLISLLPMGKENQIKKSVPNAAETTPVQILPSQSSQASLEQRGLSPTPQKPDTKEKRTFTPVTTPLFSSSSSFSELSFTSTSCSSSDSDAKSDSETSTCTDSSSDSSCSSSGSGSSSEASVEAAIVPVSVGVEHKGDTKGKVDAVFVQVEPDRNVEKPISEQTLKSVHGQIEPGYGEWEDPSGSSGLISIRVEGPSTSPHAVNPVKTPSPSLNKLAIETDKNTASKILSSGYQEKIVSVYSTKGEIVSDDEFFGVIADNKESDKENFAPSSGEREHICKVEKSCASLKCGISQLPEIEPSVVVDPLIIGADSSHFKTKNETEGITDKDETEGITDKDETEGITDKDDLAFGAEDTISAVIKLYEKTLDLTIGETVVYVDERNFSPESGEVSLPEINEGKDSQALQPHDSEPEVLPSLNTEQEEPEYTESFDPALSLVESGKESSELPQESLGLPQVSSPNKDKEEETDMATAHFQAGMYENIAKLGRLNDNGEESLDSKPIVMPPLRFHGVVIPDVSRKQPDIISEKTSEPDIKAEQPMKAPTPPALPKFRQLSLKSSPEKRPAVDTDSKPTGDSSMNVKMRTITIPGLPSRGEHMVPVRPVLPKERSDSDAESSYVEPSTVHSESLLKRPTTTPVKLMNTSEGDVSTMPNYSIEERAAVEQLRNKLRQRERLKLALKMMEEDKMKSRRSWEKKLLSGSEEDKKTVASPQPPLQETKHKCRHHHHHRRRRSTGDNKHHRRDSKESQESSVLSEKEMMLRRLGRNMRARDRRLNTPLNPLEKEASARSQDLLQLLTQSQKITADKPVILFTRSRGVDEDCEDANTIVSDSAQPMAMSTIDKINSNNRKHRRGRGKHRMATLHTPFDGPIPEGSNGNNHMDSHRSELSVMSDSAVDRLISDGTLIRTKADLALPPNVRRNIVCPSV